MDGWSRGERIGAAVTTQGPRMVGSAALSVDVVGSTALGETLDVEDVHELLAAFLAAVTAEVAAHEGQIVELAGDGVTAVFESPVGQAARAAVAVALAVQHWAIGEGALASSRVGAPPLELRAGVAVTAGEGREAATRRSAALEPCADPGTIALCERTGRLTGLTLGEGTGIVEVDGRALVYHQLQPTRSTAAAVDFGGRPDTSSQRRVVTTVFVAGSPSPDVRKARSSALRRTAEIFEQQGGTVRRHSGHRVIALFGAPRAREDDPERAIRATLEAIAAAPADAGLRAGIATGLVVVGTTDLSVDGTHFDAIGDTMNTAARLQTAAPIGDLLVDDSTWRLASDRFVARPRQVLPLKGKRHPVGVRAVVRSRPVDQLPDGGPQSLIGRDQELAHLRSLLAPVPTTTTVAVIGPAGLGKTRLTAELVRAARLRSGLRTIVVRCRPDGAGGMDPTRQLVAIALGMRPDVGDLSLARELDGLRAYADADEDTVNLLRTAARLPPGEGPTTGGRSPAVLQQAQSDAVCWLIRRSPSLVVVEDLHWADETVTAWSRALAADSTTRLVVTARPRSERTATTLDIMHAFGDVLELIPLEDHAQRRLLSIFVGEGTLPFALEQRVLRYAAGSPFVIGEIGRALLDSGRVVFDDAGPRFVGHDDLELPDTVERLVLSRLDRLAPTARAVLDVACVAGDDADVDLLADLSGFDRELPEVMGDLVEAGLLAPAGTGRSYVFTHELIQRVGYENLLRRDRRRIHAATAQALQARSSAPPARVAHHWWRSEDNVRARSWARHALDGAQRTLNHELASRLLEIVVEAERRLGLPGSDRLASMLEFGRACRHASRFPDALAAFEEAGRLAQDVGAPEAMVAAALGHEDVSFAARRIRAGQDDPTRRLLEAAARQPATVATRARVLAGLARADGFAGRGEEGRETAEEAVALARAADDPATLAYAMIAWRATHAGPRWLQARLGHADEALGAAAAAADDELALEVARGHLLDRLEAGIPAALEQETVHLAHHIAEVGQPQYLVYPPMWTVMRMLATGRLARADADIVALYDEGRRLGFTGADAMRTFQRFLLLRELGRSSELVEDAEDLAARRWDAGSSLPIVAAAAADAGDQALARRTLSTFMTDVFPGMADDLGVPGVLAALTDACCSVSDRKTAGALYERLRPYARHALVVGGGAAHLGAGSRALGELAALRGDRSTAIGHLTAAVSFDRRSGARLWEGHAAASLASLLQERAPGRAETLKATAVRIARETGSVRLRRRIERCDAASRK